jgi:hypothetical protein
LRSGPKIDIDEPFGRGLRKELFGGVIESPKWVGLTLRAAPQLEKRRREPMNPEPLNP